MPIPRPSRRALLVGGGVGAGLIVAYRLWPREQANTLDLAPGEHALGAVVKVGEDGHVTVVVPQVELGHGVFTGCAQIVADELGADWRQIAVETATGYGATGRFPNGVLDAEWRDGLGGATFGADLFGSGVTTAIMATGGSTSMRALEGQLRDAGAAARSLLCAAAAARWDVDRLACETHDGFVWHGDERMRFGEVAAEAARQTLADVAWRTGSAHRLTGAALPRLDAPAKVDGSVTFAADVRLPDMVFAAVAEALVGDTASARFDAAAARAVTGVVDSAVFDGWVAVAAVNGWIAERGLAAGALRWTTTNALDNRRIARALAAAFGTSGANGADAATRITAIGDVGEAFRDATIWQQTYTCALAAHAGIEPASATVRIDAGLIEVWLATQVPTLVQRAVARALDRDPAAVVVHPTMVGGSFGARYEPRIAVQAALLADRWHRPVQLTRARAVETHATPPRPPAVIRLAARTGDGRIDAWLAKVAAPATLHELHARLFDGIDPAAAQTASGGRTEPAAVDGCLPPYDIGAVAIDHHPVAVGVPTGDWRGRAHVANAFARECFIDELAHETGADPFGYRMGMLGGNPRLAQCLSRAAATGGWQGGVAGSGQGLACHTMAGSHVAVLAEAVREGNRIRVIRLVAVADVGRVINPDIVRSQIIGGLVFGMSAATGAALDIRRGVVGPARLADLRLPRMADCPRIEVELIVSLADPGGAGEVAVPPVAPAIAGALFAGSGVRYRQLPLLEAAT